MLKKIKVFFEEPSFKKLSILFFIGTFFIVSSSFSGAFIFSKGAPKGGGGAPGTPTVTASGTTTTSTILAFSLPKGSAAATSYSISQDGVSIGTSTKTTYTINGLSPNTSYSFTVIASNKSGNSNSSKPLSVKTLVDLPTAPLNLITNNPTTSTIDLGWDLPSDDGGDSNINYIVEYQAVRGIWTKFASNIILLNTQVNKLSPNTDWEFRVAAENSEGIGPWSDIATASTTVNVTAPDQISDFSATSVDHNSVTLGWTKPNDGGVEINNYLITGGPEDINLDPGTVDDPNNLTYIIIGLTHNTDYTFTIVAQNSEGDSTSSQVETTTISNISSGNSSISIDVDGIANDGEDLVTITTTVLDYDSNPIEGLSVVLNSIGADGDLTTISNTTDVNGIVTHTFTSTTVGTVTFSAIVDGVEFSSGELVVREPVEVFDVEVTETEVEAIFTFSTDAPASTKLLFRPGLDDVEDKEEDDDTDDNNVQENLELAINHEVEFDINGKGQTLHECFSYMTKIIATTIDGVKSNIATKQLDTNCSKAEKKKRKVRKIKKNLGGTVRLKRDNNIDDLLKLEVPVDFVPNNKAFFQVTEYNGDQYEAQMDRTLFPKNKMLGKWFNIQIVNTSNDKITETVAEIPITISYTDQEIEGIKESSLKIYNLHAGIWNEGENCSVDEGNNEVLCNFGQFSEFGVGGDEESSGGGGIAVHLTHPTKVPEDGFSMSINEEDVSDNREVLLSFNVEDDITKMAISNYSDLRDASILPFENNYSWDLCSQSSNQFKLEDCSNGNYKVYARFYNKYGNASDLVSDSIELKVEDSNKLEEDVTDKIKTYFDDLKKYFTFGDKKYYILSEEELNKKKFFETEEVLEVEEADSVALIEEKLSKSAETVTNVVNKFNRYLYKGTSGEEVKTLQSKLKNLGYFLFDKLTGYYGVITRSAVVDFQKDNNLPGVGVVGPLTRELLNKE